MTAHQVEAALAGGMLGGVVMFVGWCWLISKQLARAERIVNGFGETTSA
jgi:hypothetical protein